MTLNGAQEAGEDHLVDERAERASRGLRNLVAQITPWLLDVGSWIFGGLIAVNLVVMSSLIAVGPVDAAIRLSIAAFACALPVNVAGVCLLRLITDTKAVGLDDLTLKAFQDAGFPDIETYFPPSREREALRTRRSNVALLYSAGMGTLSLAATVTGLAAALWHMSWWIGTFFLAMTILSAALVAVVIAHALPPESDAEKALKKRLSR